MTKTENANEYLNRTLELHKIYKTDIVPIFRAYEVWRRKELAKHIVYILLAVIMLFSFEVIFEN